MHLKASTLEKKMVGRGVRIIGGMGNILTEH